MRLTKFKAITLILAVALSGCGGSGGGDDDSGTSLQTGGGGSSTDSDSDIQISSTPVINLSGVVTLMEFEEVVEEEEEDTSTSTSFGLTGLVKASAQTSSSSGSNLLGIDESGNTIFPVSNITDLIVNYSVLSPDKNILYMSVSYDDSQEYCEPLGIDSKHSLTNMPLIGPKVEINNINVNSCQDADIDESYNFLTNEGAGLYYYCSFVAYDRVTEELSCVGGTQSNDQNISGSFSTSIDIPIGNIAQGYFDNYALEGYENIRVGLKPLQFDAYGNIYIPATLLSDPDSFDQNGQTILKVSTDNSIDDVLKIDSYTFYDYGYVVLPEGDVVAYLYYSGGDGIFLIKPDGSLVKVSDDDQFQADTYNTLIIEGNLVTVLPSGGFSKVPLSWDGGQIDFYNLMYLSDEGRLFACEWAEIEDDWEYKLIQIAPYSPKTYYIGSQCDYGVISQGHRVKAVETAIGTLGTTDILSITRLSDGEHYEIFKEDDYTNAERYQITSIAYGANTIIFSADRTSAPVGTFIGEINVQKLSQGQSESEYLVMSEVASSTAASNSVRDISPLPIIEPNSTASAPKVSEVFHVNTEHSQIGFEFSEFMNRESVLESFSLLTSDGNDIPYTSFWGYKKLFIFPDMNGFEDSNNDGEIDWDDYVPLQAEQVYEASFNENTAMDVGGRLLSTSDNPNSVHELEFISRAGFFPEFDVVDEVWKIQVRVASENIIDPPDSDDDYWNFDGEKYRYFRAITLSESTDQSGTPIGRANYRIEWTTDCSYYDNGIGFRSHNEVADRDVDDYFFLGTWEDWSNVDGFGYYCYGDYGYVYSLNNYVESDYLTAGKKKFRIESFNDEITFYVYDEVSDSFVSIVTDSSSLIEEAADIWVASNYEYTINFYDLRIIELVQEADGNITEGELIAEDDFGNYKDPFEVFPDLEKVRTTEF